MLFARFLCDFFVVREISAKKEKNPRKEKLAFFFSLRVGFIEIRKFAILCGFWEAVQVAEVDLVCCHNRISRHLECD